MAKVKTFQRSIIGNCAWLWPLRGSFKGNYRTPGWWGSWLVCGGEYRWLHCTSILSERSHRPSRWRWARCRSATSALELGDVFYGAGMLWSCLANRVLIFLGTATTRSPRAQRAPKWARRKIWKNLYLFWGLYRVQGRWGRELKELIIHASSVGVTCHVHQPYSKEWASPDVFGGHCLLVLTFLRAERWKTPGSPVRGARSIWTWPGSVPDEGVGERPAENHAQLEQ